MRRPLPFLLLAITVAGCASPKPNATLLQTPLQAKQQQVVAVTRTLSLSQNASLKQATQSVQAVSAQLSNNSFKQVSAALSSAFASAGGPLVTAGALGLAASQARPASAGLQADALYAALQRAALQDTYHLAGLAAGPDGQGKVSYDDATGEVTAIESGGTKLGFAFAKPSEKQRTCTITVLATPDGTTGSLTLAVTAAGWSKQVGAAPTPYKFMGNEVPVDPNAIKLEVALVPHGDTALALNASLTADEQALTVLGKTFTHLRLAGNLPKLALDLDAHLKQADLALTGTITADTADGPEPFQLAVAYDAAKAKGTLDFTLVNAKVRIAASTSDKHDQAAALVYSTEDNSKIGQVDPPNPAAPGVLVIRFDDGTTTQWELIPKELLALAPAQPEAAPPPVFK
ncbi:MAG: hypothetical protein JWM80_1204 [Cyanobacteria bacterium RYN_339]|nr:hypothetical protein [Cyanobacteria bacterium RYN_339]